MTQHTYFIVRVGQDNLDTHTSTSLQAAVEMAGINRGCYSFSAFKVRSYNSDPGAIRLHSLHPTDECELLGEFTSGFLEMFTFAFDRDYPDYWQGMGVAHTCWDSVHVGMGSTIRDAALNALEMLAQSSTVLHLWIWNFLEHWIAEFNYERGVDVDGGEQYYCGFYMRDDLKGTFR